MKISETLLPEFDHEMANTRKALERVPFDKLSWKPHPKSMTLETLAVHIATMPEWAGVTLKEDAFDYAPPGGQPYKAPTFGSQKELLDAFDKGVAETRSALAAADDSQMMAPWTLKAGGQALFTMPRVAVIRSFVMNHTIHHRGQLSAYIRAMGGKVPAIYGESYDSAEAKKAAQA